MYAVVRNTPIALLLAAFAVSCSSSNNNPFPKDGGGGKGGAGEGGAAGRASAQGVDGGGGSSGAAGATGTVVVGSGAGYLWYAGAQLNAFTQAETAASNDDGPGVTVTPSSPASTFHDLVFDRDGRVWTLPTSGNQILRLPAAGLAGGSAPVPDLVLTSSGLLSPQALAFDPAGNLWVVNFAGAGVGIANIVCFAAPQAWSGTMTASPSVTIAPAADAVSMEEFNEGTALAFDDAGSLWFASVSTVLRIDHPSALAGAVTAAPSAALSTGEAYTSIAFDASGSLWITGTSVQGYVVSRIDDPGALTGVLTPTPAARVAVPFATAVFVGGLAFDANGALWVVTSNRVLEFTGPSALVGDVMPSPTVALGLPAVVAPGLASKLVFRPAPSGLPIY